jgi:hypothetical protein
MNPDKAKVGCVVPFCRHGWCDRKKKKLCSLRKNFLEYQKQIRAIMKNYTGTEKYEKYVFYYRRKQKHKEHEDSS